MVNNILIFRTDKIVDLLITCPVVLTIKKHLTNSKITLITLSLHILFFLCIHSLEPDSNINSSFKEIF